MSMVSPRRNRNKPQVQLFCPKCGEPLTYAKDSSGLIIYICVHIGCEYRQPYPLNEHILDIKHRYGSWDATIRFYDRHERIDYK